MDKKYTLLTISVPPALKAELQALYKERDDETFSQFVRRILRGYIRRKAAKSQN
ncbi:MAG: ribbon-helix-helix protein, CopG family [Planctomycetia bacterium]|nr:ribbon-helix-helix protein, CopG family [Planctomycetia bacterium]